MRQGRRSSDSNGTRIIDVPMHRFHVYNRFLAMIDQRKDALFAGDLASFSPRRLPGNRMKVVVEPGFSMH